MEKLSLENLLRRLKAKARYAKHFRFISDCVIFLVVYSAKLLYRLIYTFTKINKQKVVFICHQKTYTGNPKYIAEALHTLDPSLKLVWFTSPQGNYALPDWLEPVACFSPLKTFRRFYECATANVLVSSVFFDWGVKNFGKQLFISTWHGSLGIKKVGVEIPVNGENGSLLFSLRRAKFNVPDIMLSNSAILSQVYRTGFLYKGIIWRIGYPRCDKLLCSHSAIRRKIHATYGLDDDTKILLYAPTFRQEAYEGKTSDISPYSIDVTIALDAVKSRFGGKWVFAIRWHYFQSNDRKCREKFVGTQAIDVTDYPDMEELTCAADAFISDYSSGIFDARMAGLPCFLFATDAEEYECISGFVEPIESYPFPYATNNDELTKNIKNYDATYYDTLWQDWSTSRGLILTGRASYYVASLINKFTTDDVNYMQGVENDCSNFSGQI